MSKAEHMGVSPSQVSGQIGNDSCPKQRTSEQASEFGAECAHSEPPELQHLLGSEALQNKPQEISTAVTSSYTIERISGHLSKSSQTNKDSYCQQTLSEQKNEFAAECISSEQLELKHQLEVEIIRKEPKEISTVMCSSVDNENLQPVSEDVSKSSKETSIVMSSSVDNENLQPVSEYVSKSSKETGIVMCKSVDNENLQPVSEDVSKSSQTDTKQTLEFVSGHGCDELNVECIDSELLEQKHRLGSKTIRNKPADADAIVTGAGVDETLQLLSEDVTKVCHTELLQSLPKVVSKNCQIGENSCPQQPTSASTLELTAGITSHGLLEVIDKASSELVQNEPGETSTAVSCSITIGQLGSPPELLNKSSPIEHLKQPDDYIKIPSAENLEPSSDNMAKNSSNPKAPPKYVLKNSKQLGHKGKKASKSLKKKYILRSLRRSDRVLRSRSHDKPKAPESSNNLAEVSSTVGKRIKKQNRREKKLVVDEYSRIRTHLRYLLNRINYERSLISAYSGEGWKGLSIEKLKPEKELQRATSEILRRKLKIRDLFQRLDSLCAEGRFPESLFDSEGQIDSEDIFCAKCGSKDLSADNDIILCDGACDRGFHQNCLEPPLLKEDIPPDEEGWLCPGCDCKVDCIDLVNDSQGTNLFITDNWEKVFPEAAAAGHNQDPNFGLPSDDSDDNDYDPDGSATDEKNQGDESSSDESDFTSASDELEPIANSNEDLGLPSEDSEDDDYNPDAPVLDEKVTQESSSSDFTSDSEDLAAVLQDKSSSRNDEGATSVSPLRDSNGQRSKCDGNNESLNNELLSILDSGHDGLVPSYEKRSIERLDYKKLYDETYRNAPSDSSDDEDWTDNGGPSKRMKRTGEGSPVSPNGNASAPSNRKQKMDIKQNLKQTEHNPNRRTCRKLSSEDTHLSSAKSLEGSSTHGSIGGREKSSYRRLGEDVTQRLYKSFKENQYPDRTAKEALARGLGITFSQVSKWFENARWSFNHSSSMDAKLGISASEKSTCMSQSNKKPVRRAATVNGVENVEPPKTGVRETEHSRGDVMNIELATQESNGKKSTTGISSNRKRKGKLGQQASDLPADSPEAQETQTSGQTRTRRRKTVV